MPPQQQPPLLLRVTDAVDAALGDFFDRRGRHCYRNPRTNFFVPVAATVIGILLFQLLYFTEARGERLFTPQNSRSFQERSRFRDWFPGEARENNFIFTTDPNDANLLTPELLLLQLEVHERVLTITRDSLSYLDVCDRNAVTGECAVANILALWDYDADVIAARSEAELLDDLNQYIASGDRAVNYVALLSGEDFDDDGRVLKVRAHMASYPTTDALEEESKVWELEMLDLGAAINEDDADRFADIEVTYQTWDSIDLELEKATGGDFFLVALSFIVMVNFVSLSYGSRNRIHSHSLLATSGVAVVGMAIMTGFGVALAIRQPFISIVGFLPFLAISIGVDDIFILMDNLVAIDPGTMNPEERLALTFRRAGSSILTTTVTDCLAFLVGTSSVFPAIRIFCVYALLVLGIDFVYQITAFGVIMRYFAVREHENRPECCLSRRKFESPEIANTCGGSAATGPSLIKRAMRAYATVLSKGPVKGLVLLAFSAWLAVSILYAYEIDEGLDLRDVVPHDSYMIDTLDAQDKYFRAKGIPFDVLIADVDVRDRDTQDGILSLREALQADDWVNDAPETFVSWMELFFQWYAAQPGADASGRPPADEFYDQLDLFLAEPTFAFLKTELVRESDAAGAAVLASRVSAFFESSENTLDDARSLRSVRAVLDGVKRDEGFPELFAFFEAFIYWEQIYETTPSVIQNLILAGVAVTVVTLVLLGHPLASFLVLLMVVLTDFYLFGWMGLLGVPLDTVSLVSLTMAVGFTVDYSSHVAHAFMHHGSEADGRNDRNKRMILAMEDIGGSVLKGATSTMLGTIVLAGSQSAIFANFFKHMCGVVIFGGLSGLCLLPVILSLIGPERARAVSRSPDAKEMGEPMSP